MLVVYRGPNAGTRFPLDQEITTAGRHRRSDLFLDDVTVSRHHAEFHWDSGELRIVDVGSLNGTYVNGQRIDSAVLTDGDEIQMAKFRLVSLVRPRRADTKDRSAVDNSLVLPTPGRTERITMGNKEIRDADT
jgi:pSer/pThr/pTyr-binding forkhead associated (FHA) protein